MRVQVRLLLLLAMSGCATSAVAPRTVPALAGPQGLVFIAVDTNVALQSLVFTGPEGFTILAADTGLSGHLFAVPAGDYRLSDFRTTYGVYDSAAQPATLCVRVTPARVAYPGHLVFRDRREGEGLHNAASWGWRENRPDAKARLETRWPGLADRYPLADAACP